MMAATSATSPISNLNNDTLLSIFDIMTSQMPDHRTLRKDRPIFIMRSVSQVCQQWRGLVVESPWIWGRHMDFDGPRASEWLEEIFRRAGSARLWIYGSVVGKEKGVHFIRLLESWERIEKLSVNIYSDINVPDEILNRFLSPAPSLKVFKVLNLLSENILFIETLQPGSPRTLFAEHAPLLRTLETERIAYRLNSPWLSNLREIVFFPGHLSLKDIFTILEHTPVIETISLNSPDLIWQQTYPSLDKLSLPRLSSMELWTNLPALATILGHISPGSLSRLLIQINRKPSVEPIDSLIVSAFKENLACYVTNYLNANPPNAVLLETTRSSLRFCGVTNSANDFAMADLEIATDSHSADEWDNIIVCVFNALTVSLGANPSILESITRMSLSYLGVRPAMIPTLYSFLSLFRHVCEIVTKEEYVHAFCALSPNNALEDPEDVLFPRLHTLQLASTGPSRNNLYTDLTSYIMRRKSLGFPLAQLDLTTCTRSNYARRLHDLDLVDGLEVIWKEQNKVRGEL